MVLKTFGNAFFPNRQQGRGLDEDSRQHSAVDVAAAVYSGLSDLYVPFSCFAAFLMRQLKDIVIDLQLFNLL